MNDRVLGVSFPTFLFDILAIAFIYYVPALSHVVAMPFYLFEPFRLVVLTSLIVLANSRNAFFLALTLPVFSFFVSGHPLFAKMILISGELFLNIVLYNLFSKHISTPYCTLFLSIALSKAVYYLLKFAFISMGILPTTLVSNSLFAQLIVAVFTALFFGSLIRRKVSINE